MVFNNCQIRSRLGCSSQKRFRKLKKSMAVTKELTKKPTTKEIENQNTKSFLVSSKLWVFIVVSAYFVYSTYVLLKSLNFSGDLIVNYATYLNLLEVPWWATLFYASELGGTIGGILRSIGSGFALYSALHYLKKGNLAFPKIKQTVVAALLFEAGFYLFLIPTVILGFAYPLTNGTLWYFEVTPVPEVFFVAGVACLALVAVIPFVLIKLSTKIIQGSSKQEIVKWSLIVGVSYLFVVFWFDALMQWVGMVASFGSNLLFDPLNFAGFLFSAVGLFLIASFALVSVFPVIKKKTSTLRIRRVGLVMVLFGSYFVFGILIYFLAGGFAERPFAWYEIIVPHNSYLWCVVFLFTGIPFLKKQPTDNI